LSLLAFPIVPPHFVTESFSDLTSGRVTWRNGLCIFVDIARSVEQ